ncbi:MAG: hypothetical protein J5685_03955 [Clostridiales bacterium]|nr:hypothetical protein [Clostridiales bacterium]
MGLFNKLFGEAAKALENLGEEAVRSAVNGSSSGMPHGDRPVPQWEQEPAGSYGPSGDSWGPDMPAEENQFNFRGNYREYFEHIFAEDFPSYQVDKEIPAKWPNRTVYRLSSGGVLALVIEILPESSGTKRLREECRASGTPYLRFYHNHDGWWNTRSYVKGRISKALNG